MIKITLILAAILSFITVFAQQSSPIVKLSLKDKKDKLVELQAFDETIYVEGYDGDELTIEPYNPPVSSRISEEPFIKNHSKWVGNIELRASYGKLGDKGLKDITALTDRTIPPVETKEPLIRESAQYVSISLYASVYKSLLVKIPRSTHLKLLFSGQSPDTKVSLKDLTGELEIRGRASLIDVNNISGPLTLSSTSLNNSKINISHIKWDNVSLIDKKSLFNISANTDDVDISLPADLKATINVHVNHGDIYSDLDLFKKYPESNQLNSFSGDLNGGGPFIMIIAEYGNVYLRKEK